MSTRPPIARIALACACLLTCSSALAQSRIANTKHNLSVSGPGLVKVAGETEICKFCHTPHAASPAAPLWNRDDPGTYYQTYESTTLAANVGQPTGSSRLCLSCHDGTIALTETYSPSSRIAGTLFISASDAGYLGTKLSDDHPVSFTYNSSLVAAKPELHDPSVLTQSLPLDDRQELQCTTCHDPHNNTHGYFLRMNNRRSSLCVTCHNMSGWSGSAHAVSVKSVAGSQRDSWNNLSYQSVGDIGCEGCHRPHNAGSPQRLLRHEAEESNCFSCHDGSVASKNIHAEFQKPFSHPVDNSTGIHNPTEKPNAMAWHVECQDCHDPHQSAASPAAQAPLIKPTMKGVSGVTGTGAVVTEARYEYQVCYKCHAGTSGSANATPVVDRIDRSTDVAFEFSSANASYHPIEAAGKNSDVPSLMQGYTVSSMIYCTDCHGSNAGAGGAKGPHGSTHEPMLVKNYSTADNTRESSPAYALCYTCHNSSSILDDDSFDKHKKHIKGEHTPCSVCHDPHGSANNTHLINFDRDVVFRSDKAKSGPTFEDRGFRRGSCTLTCHGKDHKDEDYKP